MSFQTTPMFLLQVPFESQREDRSAITLWKGKGCGALFMGSVGARKVLRCPLPPSEASWALLTPWERGNDFQGLVRLERTASQHLEGIMLLLPKGETQGVDDGGVTVCVWTKLCLIYTEWLNYIVFWELGYKTMTSWEVLSWMRVANRDDGR